MTLKNKIHGCEIQDISTSISIAESIQFTLGREKLIKVTNIYKDKIIDTHA